MKKWMILAGVAVACGLGAQAASFTNLNFEAYAGTGDELLPGWEWTEGYQPQMDWCPLVTASVGLISRMNAGWGGCGEVLEGMYTAHITTGEGQRYYDEGCDCMVELVGNPISIWQTAQVPHRAKYIRFLSSGLDNASLGGIALITDGGAQLQYTVDIGSLAGQEATLRFSADNGHGTDGHGNYWAEDYWLDQIEFLDAGGTVVWPLPPPVRLEDFHGGTLNTTLWEVAISGQTNAYSVANQNLRTTVMPPTAPFETVYRYRAELRGDWDVQVDYGVRTPLTSSTNVGVLGTALAAEFGSGGTSKASVGRLVDVDGTDHRYAVDWGQGPTGDLATTAETGIFRLVRTGWEVAGYVWDAGSNDWQIVGTMGGYTDETARVGLKVWGTGAFSGKSAYVYSDNLMLANGRASLAGLAVKTFGLDGAGAPTVAWDSAGMPTSTRVVVTRATSLVDSVWTPVSGAIGDAGGETNWTGSGGAEGPAYYRLQVVPGN